MKEKLPTLILRAAAIASAIAAVIICVFALPSFGIGVGKNFPQYAFLRYPALIGLYTAAGCFFFALFNFWALLSCIDKEGTLSPKRLRIIRNCSIAFSVLYFIFAMPIIFLAAEADDAPGLILVGAFFDSFPISAAAIAAILERIVASGSNC